MGYIVFDFMRFEEVLKFFLKVFILKVVNERVYRGIKVDKYYGSVICEWVVIDIGNFIVWNEI